MSVRIGLRGRNGAAPADGGVRTATAGMAAGHCAGSQRTTASGVVPDAKDHPPFTEGALPVRQRVESRVRAEVSGRDHVFQLRDGRLEGRIAPQELPGPVAARQRRHGRLRRRAAQGNIVSRPREDMQRPRSMAPSRKQRSQVVAMRAPARSIRFLTPRAAKRRRAWRRRPCADRQSEDATSRTGCAQSRSGEAQIRAVSAGRTNHGDGPRDARAASCARRRWFGLRRARSASPPCRPTRSTAPSRPTGWCGRDWLRCPC